MKTPDWIALGLSIVAFFTAVFVSNDIYEGIPHIEDEITYVWQARLAAAGKMTIDSPACPSCFLEPFVIDLNGNRFGKYPPGWPAMLSLGIRLGVRNFVNPFLSALFVWWNYLLVKKLLNPEAGLLASLLTISSPFFLMNSATLLAHPWSLLLAVVFVHAWLDTLSLDSKVPKWMTGMTAVFSLGLLILTRPLTAVGICFPFLAHGIIVLVTGSALQKKNIALIGFGTLIFSVLYLLWQFQVTGDFLQNPYVLYWPYDKIGFGPDVGLHPDGHQLKYALINTRFSLRVGMSDLFGWPMISWIFLPFGLLAIRKKPQAQLASSVIFSLVVFYALYWIGSWLYGPRYYFEGFFSLTILSAAGVQFLAGKVKTLGREPNLQRLRYVVTLAVFSLLILGNVVFYLPMRVGGLHGLYGMQSSQLTPFMTKEAQALTPALVIVEPHDYWLEYGVLLELSSPLLDTPFIFSYDRGEALNQVVIDSYPDRNVIYYKPEQPYTFFVKE